MITQHLSPLRYPGGKSRAVHTLSKYLPPNLSTLVSPFFGGGSFELYCAHKGIQVIGYDFFQPLVFFWNSLLFDKENLVSKIQKYHPLSKKEFYNLRAQINIEQDPTLIASIFFTLNRCSFSGSTLSGGMSPNHPRFTQSSIDKIKKFSINNLSIQHMHFEESIPKHSSDFLYLDPPYFIKNNLYGNNGALQKNFDHEKLFSLLSQHNNWILSYNNCSEILDMYRNYEIIHPKWSYGMSNNKTSNEILILNYAKN